MSDREVKQVIIMRTDTVPKMRKGKMIAQGAHASIAFLTGRLRDNVDVKVGSLNNAERQWIERDFVKICVKADLDVLLACTIRALSLGIETNLITDAGKTEFKEPTITCVAIGPWWADELDKITGHLELL